MLDRRHILAAAAAFALSGGPALAQDAKIPVVATFTILGDFAREIGGDRVDVTTIVGPNGDVHVYDPSPADSRKIAAAKLVVENGLYLEGWMTRLTRASGAKARIVVASDGITPRKDMSNGELAAHRGIDPHAWQSIPNAETYVRNIRDGLIAVDPAGEAYYDARAKAYLARLAALDADVRAAIAKIPPANRRIITTHDAFGYFGQAYGMAFVAPEGFATEAEASARDVAKIITQIRRDKFPAVFLENVTNPNLMNQIARETGAKIGGTLYSDALSPPNGPAGTFIAMMKHNISELTKALAPST